MDNRERIAWAAGVIEGEGCIQATKGRLSSHDGRRLICFSLRVVMTDLDVIERLHETFGVGSVFPYKNLHGLGTKQLYCWDVRRATDVKAVCVAIHSFMGQRRKAQIDAVLQALEAFPPVDNAERVRRSWITRKTKATA